MNLSADEKPARTPRTSFGVELEFLVAVMPDTRTDPDSELDGILPPLPYTTDYWTTVAIARCLMEYGVPVFEYKRFASSKQDGSMDLPELFDALAEKASSVEVDSWTVKTDFSVQQQPEAGYSWAAVEITSPASFAIPEAFDMIRLVVHIVTSNFRCRVNDTCGFHVHFGNGRSRIDLHTARNFAALWWAAEPMLTMLHPPERGFSNFCKSSRRTRASALASCSTAKDVSYGCLPHPSARLPHMPKMARYYGRERRMGESPEVENIPSLEEPPHGGDWRPEDSRLLPGWKDEDDDVDWMAENMEPFRRPKKPGHPRPIQSRGPKSRQQGVGGPELHVQLSSSVVGNADRDGEDIEDREAEPTEGIELGNIKESIKPGSGEAGSDSGRSDECEIIPLSIEAEEVHLRRPRTSPLARQNERRHYEPRPLEILIRDEAAAARYEVTGHRVTEEKLATSSPWRTDFWSGIMEIFSCDIGVHQIACLMGLEQDPNWGSKYMNINWTAYTPNRLSEGLLLESDGQPSELDFDTIGYRTGFVTLESREGQGTLDGDWIVLWARVLCGLMDWSRRASPSEMLRILGLCENPAEYDVVDMLHDMGLYEEAALCEKRLLRGPEAWFDCIVLEAEPDFFDETFEEVGFNESSEENGAPASAWRAEHPVFGKKAMEEAVSPI